MTPAERKALAFFVGLAALGAGARAAGLGVPAEPLAPGDPAADERQALDRQLAAVDSARASRRPRERKGSGEGTRRRPAPAAADSPGAPPVAAPPVDLPPAPAGPVDADHADSAALEALPGIGPALAQRIVADRRARGAFGSMAGLSRVPGIGPGLERRLAPLVTFGGRP